MILPPLWGKYLAGGEGMGGLLDPIHSERLGDVHEIKHRQRYFVD